VSTPSFAAIAPGNLAVITGAATGIGLAAAKAFAARGMRIAMIDRPGEALDAAAAALDGATPYGVDVADADAAAMRELATQIDTASVLMNNAGIGEGGDVFAGDSDGAMVGCGPPAFGGDQPVTSRSFTWRAGGEQPVLVICIVAMKSARHKPGAKLP
jgi:NAD(P)-dependent dehydrogenase (short-subunit alcohol dehydrogenase family)